MNGYGVFFWKDGRIYKGCYKDDKKDEFGMYYKSQGKKYEGFWVNGAQNNLGKYTKSDGAFKFGMWKDNILDITFEGKEFEEKLKLIESCIEETNFKVNESVENLRDCFSIYLPNSKIEDFL